jgi:hypothetical protein
MFSCPFFALYELFYHLMFLHSFLQLRDKALTCYEKIRDSANTHGPVDQVSLGEHQSDIRVHISTKGRKSNDGDKHQSDKDCSQNDGSQQPFQAQVPDFSADSLHLLPLFSNFFDLLSDEEKRNQIVMAIERHDKMMDGAVANVQKGERLVSEGKDMMKEAHSKLESGERMVFEGKSMIKEAHLKLISEVRSILW